MKIQLKKGVTELLVLALLSTKDRYGYEIVDTISDFVEMSEGTIYPLLKRLQQDKLVETYLEESNSGPTRKYYKLTEIGKSTYVKEKKEWNNFYVKVNQLLTKVEGVNNND